MRLLCCVFTLAAVVGAAGMDRWSALSMLESGDHDLARGRAGEISRFQIKPVEWRRVAHSPQSTRVTSGGRPTDARAALAVAQRIMAERSAGFQRTHLHPPTDYEFYILWNAPAQVDHPSRVVRARARRFCNLVARQDSLPNRSQI